MGCISSKKDINDLHPNIFQVMNVDQFGNRVSPGELEITVTDLVLHQRKKAPVKWPLRRLRRYGFEGELFSFESGRRCATGSGIYAFHCLRAERLFGMLQSFIQEQNMIVTEEGAVAPIVLTGPVVPLRRNVTIEPNYVEPSTFNDAGFLVLSHSRNNSRLGSVGSSTGPLSPQGPSSPSSLLPPAPPLPPIPSSAISFQRSNEYNNNRRTYINSTSAASSNSLQCRLNQSSVDGLDGDSGVSKAAPIYSNIEIGSATGPLSPTFSVDGEHNYERLEVGRMYMNIVSRPEIPVTFPRPADWKLDETRHCYANLVPSEIEIARRRLPKRLSGSERPPPSIPLSPPGITRQVNYIVLDLDQSKKEITALSQQQPTTPVSTVPTSTLVLPQELAGKASESYATIDFNRTVALSHSVTPNVVNDSEGSRKTRHNSTINDLALPTD